MDRIFSLCSLLLISVLAFAQSPAGLSYQTVVRDNTGEAIANTSVSLRMSVHSTTAGGTTVFQETHSPMTNDHGLVSVVIGQGSTTIGSFGAIEWGGDSYFLEVELDPAGGSSYTTMGTSQMMSVPYALYANEVSPTALPDPSNAVPIAYQGDTLYVHATDSGTDIAQGAASAACTALNTDGYTDWYLPSISELNAMYKQSYLLTGLEEGADWKYWSSTLTGVSDAFTRRLDYGGPDPDDTNVAVGHKARCIRQNP